MAKKQIGLAGRLNMRCTLIPISPAVLQLKRVLFKPSSVCSACFTARGFAFFFGWSGVPGQLARLYYMAMGGRCGLTMGLWLQVKRWDRAADLQIEQPVTGWGVWLCGFVRWAAAGTDMRTRLAHRLT